MRKRIVIGLLAIAVMAAGASIFSRPKPGTVDYHKAEYLKARDALEERSLAGLCRRLVHQTTGVWKFRNANVHKELREKLDAHEAALIQCGYLVNHQIVITNNYADVLEEVLGSPSRLFPKESMQYTRVVGGTGPFLDVVGRKSDIAKWEEVIRMLDTP